MFSVGVKVGVEAGNYGYLVTESGKEGLHSQWSFRGDVDYIGAETFPVPFELVESGQTHFQDIVSRNRNSLDQVLGESLALSAFIVLGLPRPDDVQAVPLGHQPGDQLVQSRGNPVDFGWKSFGNQADFHSGLIAVMT